MGEATVDGPVNKTLGHHATGRSWRRPKYIQLINHYRMRQQKCRTKSCTYPKTQKTNTKKMAQISIYPKTKKITKKTRKIPPSFVLAAVTVGAGQSINLCSANYASYSSRHVSGPAGQWTLDNRHLTPDRYELPCGDTEAL